MPKENGDLFLWFEKPTKHWSHTLPLGNGRLGAMIFGKITKERIQFNEETFWTGHSYNNVNPNAYKYLKQVRELIFNQEYFKADEMIEQNMLGSPDLTQAYQNFGDLYISFEDQKDFTNYRRELDLNTAIVNITYQNQDEDINFSRSYFTSRPANVMVMKFTCDHPRMLNFSISMKRKYDAESQSVSDDTLALKGKWICYRGAKSRSVYDGMTDGMEFEARLKVINKNGEIKRNEDSIEVIGADEAILILDAETSYQTKSPGELCQKRINSASEKSYQDLLKEHIKDYQSLFNRVNFQLKHDEENLPTRKILRKLKFDEEDLALIPLVFQYGRYLMISSSRPKTKAITLQGLWNRDITPEWGSNYTVNTNIEMNYWPAEVCNLSECHEPLFDLITELVEHGKEIAGKHYNCRGFCVHHNTDFWRPAGPFGKETQWAFWPMSAGWLCTHLWEHYLFTEDKAFLEKYYPIIKEATLFFVDWLIEDKDGFLVTNPSTSPENSFIFKGEKCGVSIASTMDMQIISKMFEICIETSKILNTDNSFRELLIEKRNKMFQPKISKEGYLQEWSEDFEEWEPGHRHFSHVYGFHPSDMISLRKTPKLVDAVKKSISKRLVSGSGSTEWSSAWLISIFARFLDGENAKKWLITLLRDHTEKNLIGFHMPHVFQVDSCFGLTAGIAEMLLQSHDGAIRPIPALPKSWETGYIRGLRARGGFEVDIYWENGSLKKMEIQSFNGNPCRIISTKDLAVLQNTKKIMVSRVESDILEFSTKENTQYTIYPSNNE